jgi:hypothetical protein
VSGRTAETRPQQPERRGVDDGPSFIVWEIGSSGGKAGFRIKFLRELSDRSCITVGRGAKC